MEEDPHNPLSRRPIHTIKVGYKKLFAEAEEKQQNGTLEKEEKIRKKPPTEFGGWIGALLMILILPIAVVYLNLLPLQRNSAIFKTPTRRPHNWLAMFFDWKVWKVLLGWLGAHLLLAIIPLGEKVTGRELANGKKLTYRCNATYAFLLIVGAFSAATYMNVPIASFLYRNWLRLACCSIVCAFIVSIVFYVASFFKSADELSEAGSSGSVLYGLFMGRELNPRFLWMDFKFLCELRPGLIGWTLMNLAAFIVTLERYEESNWALTFVVGAQMIYAADAIFYESAIISTMDIMHEGFGFMLIFGNLVWVPFTYSLQARYLSQNPTLLTPWPYLIPVAVLHCVGFYIFRNANCEKDTFRNDPEHEDVRDLESIGTGVAGRRILCGGWWGVVRHPNYLGDLLMAWSWGLACGFRSVLPYFYPVFLTILLITRELRDERMMVRKYGSAWTEYCRRVKYRIVPYIW